MKKAAIALIAVLVVFAVVYLAGSWYFSGFVVAFDVKSLEQERAEKGAPADFGLPEPKEVAIQAGDVTLAGWVFDNPADGNCGVILLHGITGNRYGMLKYAPLLWPRGCDLLVYDHRYHGASTGDYGTYGYYEKQDALAALAWFSQRTGLPADRIGLFGESYGAATALQAAALEPDVAFAAADSSYRDLKTIVTEQGVQRFGGWVQALAPGALAIANLRTGMNAGDVSPMAMAEAIREPVFLSHSASDEFTAPHHSEDIFPHLPDTVCKRLVLTDWGAEHAESIDDDFARYKVQFDEFLDACVPGFGVTGAAK